MDDEIKIWLAIRADIVMSRGKLAVQSGHAFAEAVLRADPAILEEYRANSMVKIALRVESEEELLMVYAASLAHDIPSFLVRDAGRTEFTEPTYTVCAFGPCRKSELPSKLKRIRLYDL